MKTEPSKETQWYHSTLEKLVLSMLEAQEKQRWWNTVFKLILVSLFCFSLFFMIWIKCIPWIGTTVPHIQAHIGLIDIEGDIQQENGNSPKNILFSLQKAFESPGTAAVVLRINSGGGHIVPSSQIYEEIRYQKKIHPNVPVLAVCDNVCASGAYFIASASDQIYANPVSIIGSIGAYIDGGFGLVETLKREGKERRLFIAGKYKSILDPYLPMKDEEKKMIQVGLDEMHNYFIEAVKKGRGQKLKHSKENDSILFSGQVWSGQKALALGLVDGLANFNQIAREVIKVKKVVNYTLSPIEVQRMSKSFEVSFAK